MILVCFDSKGPTFRKEIYDAYKANRSEPPEDFVPQINIAKNLLNELGISYVEQPGFEADDLIGSACKTLNDLDIKALVMTSDQDSFQLVSELTHIIVNKKGVSDFLEVDIDNLMKYYDLKPDMVIDYKALKGDASDNIPGVKGIGDKTAKQLLNSFKTLENIYENINEISSKSVQSKLTADKNNAFLSKKLATIEINLDIDYKVGKYDFKPDWEQICDVFSKYEFLSLERLYRKNIDKKVVKTEVKMTQKNYKIIDNEVELESYFEKFKNGFAIDLETTTLDPRLAQIVGISICFKEDQAIYLPMNNTVSKFDSQQTLFNNNLTVERIENPLLTKMKPILEDAKVEKYAHNAKYEIQVLKQYGIELNGVVFDTMIAAFLFYPESKINLKDLALRLLGMEMREFKDLIESVSFANSIEDVPIQDVKAYACDDANATFKLKTYFDNNWPSEKLKNLFYDIEMEVLHVISDMELSGVTLDQVHINYLKSIFEKKSIDLKDKIYHYSEEEFNINSTKQLSYILFEKLKLPVIKKLKTGYSTDSSVLEKLKGQHPVIQELIEYRMLEKLLTTYINSLPKLISPITNKIHANFNQTITMTGRLSSTTPNLQNIPIRSDDGQQIRQAFIPSDSKHKILAVDYSQIELRIMAALSNDKNMIDSFNNDIDIHKTTAATINQCHINEVTDEQRYNAKAINFGILYGISAFGLSQNLSITREEAQLIIDNYFDNFPNIKIFIDGVISEAKKTNSIETLFGRIRKIPDINHKAFMKKQYGERMAVNTLIQGTAADIIKIAMVNISNKIQEKKYKSKMIIQVHDELVFDMDINEAESFKNMVIFEMENAVDLSVKLKVNSSMGDNWAEAK